MHGTAKPKNNRSPLQSSTSWPSNADATVWTKRLVASRVRDKFYDEAEVSAAMKNPKIQIKIALGLGKDRGCRAYLQSHQGICRDQRATTGRNRPRRR